MAEDVPWFDVLVRRPNYDIDLQQLGDQQLPEPTKEYTSIYPQAGREDIRLVLNGFPAESELISISSGLYQWDASDVLCNYLLTNKIDGSENKHLLELGSGLGRCGLLACKLQQYSSIVLSDGDTNTLQLLRMNVAQNISPDDNISCQQLLWGEEATDNNAHDLLRSRRNDDSVSCPRFDIIVGSDLLYTNMTNLDPLFETVDTLLDKFNGGGRFILAHDEDHLISVNMVESSAAGLNLFCEVLQKKGSIHLLCFRRTNILVVNKAMKELHEKITELESKICTLEVDKKYAEDKILKLDERCTVLRGDDNLPKSILLIFDEDNLASILSFLEPQDFAALASTCKRFGAKTHQIVDGDVSLMKKIAYNLYESASMWEKEALSLKAGYSPFFLYNELNKLRMPLKFDRLLGTMGIQHTAEDMSMIEPIMSISAVRKHGPLTGESGESLNFYSYTAVSDYVMMSGKHYVTFTCSQHSENIGGTWFGIVRPLKGIAESGYFTPFCSVAAHELRELQCSEWGDSNIHACVYKALDGHCQWTDWGDSGEDTNEGNARSLNTKAWEGMQSFGGCGKIGLLLDYDGGTLTMYKDGIKLGVMKEGLSGTYCWMVTVGPRSKARIKIERGSLPEDDKVPQEKRSRVE